MRVKLPPGPPKGGSRILEKLELPDNWLALTNLLNQNDLTEVAEGPKIWHTVVDCLFLLLFFFLFGPNLVGPYEKFTIF